MPVNFASAKQAPNTTATTFACTDCWDYATRSEENNHPEGNYEYWNRVFQDCNENLNPCAGQLDEVIVSRTADTKD